MPSSSKESHELRLTERPDFELGSKVLRLVDLFSGCGGITLGVAQAAHAHQTALDVALAVDFEESATKVYEANFPKARSIQTASVESLFPGKPGTDLTAEETTLRDAVGRINVLVGGPPCQGHSNLNNHTRRNDPKNGLYAYMARASEVLTPEVIIIENVPAVQHDRHNGRNVVDTTRSLLAEQGYSVVTTIASLFDLGVAQRRRRHVMLAIAQDLGDPAEVLKAATATTTHHNIAWAIKDLESATQIGFDLPPRASATNLERMAYLLERDEYDLPNHLRPKCHQDDHSYKSMYGRLNWAEPAQTITSGYGSIGQGRYMHPSQPRALTPHEAARLQGFPDYFDFSAISSRSELAVMIGNAVPPQLSRALVAPLVEQLDLETTAGSSTDT